MANTSFLTTPTLQGKQITKLGSTAPVQPASTPAPATSQLLPARKEELRGIVGQMIQNKESDANIKAVVAAYTSKYAGEQEPKPTPEGKHGIAGFLTGAAKGLGSTLNSAANLGQKILGNTAGRVANAITGKGFTPTQQTDYQKQLSSNVKEAVTPRGTAEKIGFGTEQVAEFLAPVGQVTKAQKLLDVAVEGLKAPALVKAGAKVLGKAGIEGAGQAAVRFTQTGSGKEAGIAGLTGGGIKAITGTAGAALKAFNVPETLYSKIFKNSYRDMEAQIKSVGTEAFQKANPERFQQLVTSGVIKLGKDGGVLVNETLAKQALDRGLKGSLKNMANETVRQLYENEATVQGLVKGSKQTFALPGQYRKVLTEIAADYKNVGFGETATEARNLAAKIKNGTADSETVLQMRRFFDRMRIRSSYNPGQKLTQTQENFKFLSNNLRGKLKEIPGMENVMGDYSFNIDALEALAKDAARRENKDVLGLIDAALFGGGVASGEPMTGAAIGLTRRVLNSPKGLTTLGQGIQKGTLTKTGAVLKGAIQLGRSSYTNQQSQELPQ